MSSIDRFADIHARLAAAEATLASIGQSLSPLVAELDIAVLIPARDNAETIGAVVSQFRAALPEARVYVYDNNSRDTTATAAREAGAVVRREPMPDSDQIRARMLADVEADIYILADAEGLHDPADAPRLVTRMIETQADMAVAARITPEKSLYPSKERVLPAVLKGVYGDRFTDAHSAYRAVSRRFAKSYPAGAFCRLGETGFALHALDLGMTISEIQSVCRTPDLAAPSKRERAASAFRNLIAGFGVVRDYRPLATYGAMAGMCALAAIAATLFGAPGLAGGVGLLALASLGAGGVLDSLRHTRQENRRMVFNQVESLPAKLERLAQTRSRINDVRNGARAERAAQDLTRPMPLRRTH
ncbi:MAG: glycosyltransferase [Hyphomonadaceae bacterium]